MKCLSASILPGTYLPGTSCGSLSRATRIFGCTRTHHVDLLSQAGKNKIKAMLQAAVYRRNLQIELR